ncbi:hypothetical protein AB5I83_02180 [Mesobacillus sp. LC4]
MAFFCFPLTNNLSRGKIASIKSPIEQIGDQKIKIPEKEVTNEAHWRQKIKIPEKEVTNEAHWHPKNQDYGKTDL